LFESFLNYRSGRWVWIATGIVLLSVLGYVGQDLAVPPNGGSPYGYTSGTFGALLMVWLTWLGRRKRDYRSTLGTLKGWTSAHVYLGAALIVIATLHTGFQFGFNIHTFAYALMMIVCASGIYGVWGYLRYPSAINENSGGKTRSELFDELAEVDRKVLRSISSLDPEVQRVIEGALERTFIGQTFFDQLLAKDRSRILLPGLGIMPNQDMKALVIYLIDRAGLAHDPTEKERLQMLSSLIGRRARFLSRLRRDIQLVSLLRGWLVIHVPLALTTLAALLAHIVSVFVYW